VLSPLLRPRLFDHIVEYASSRGYHVDTINGVEDHVHCLVRFESKHAISEIVNAIKGESSHWINAGNLTRFPFAWQPGFSSFTVSPSQIHHVRRYIEQQEEHHRHRTFAEEIEGLMRLHELGGGPEGPGRAC
jgi:REP element-mobilizing transposase RayT